MKKIAVILIIINLILAAFLITNIIKMKMDSEVYNHSAALAITEIEKGLQEFEILIMADSSDLNYYKNIAKGFSPAFYNHGSTVDRYVVKYESFYLEDYSISRDSIRQAVFDFTKIKSQEDLTTTREVFLAEYEKFKDVVETIEEMEGLK